MTLRAKSRTSQWMRWLSAALVALAIYVVLSRILYGSMNWNIVLPRNQRIVLPILAFFWLYAWETRWDGKRREKKVKGEGQGDEVEKAGGGGQTRKVSDSAGQPVVLAPRDHTPSDASSRGASMAKEGDNRCPLPSLPSVSSAPAADDATGEILFNQARALRHRSIPDFDKDDEYLELLWESAAKGHAPASAKLGEYAMRRRAWVEAYYWMKLAQRNGMHGLTPILRKIRKHWSQEGFPRQSSNVNPFFTAEAGALGRALLRLDTGHQAAKAREFLKANHPEFCV